MSSTGRTRKNGIKPERIDKDFYTTPYAAVESLLKQPEIREFFSKPRVILEPCAGSGSIVKAFDACLVKATSWDLVELRPEARQGLLEITKRDTHKGYIDVYCPKDFLDFKVLGEEYDAVVTNPPFYCWQEFLEKSLTLAPVVIFLLRQDVLGSLSRHDFWQKHRPMIITMSKRHSFTPDKKPDSCYYSWFVWGLEGKGTWRVV